MNRYKLLGSALVMAAALWAGTAAAASKPADATDRARGYIKPSAPVLVRYRLLGQAAVGAPVDLEIILQPERQVEGLEARLESRRSMAVARRGALERMAGDPGAQAFRQVITLVPAEEGLHHVNVLASVQIDGAVQTRIVSVPVQVGRSTKVIRDLAPPNGELTVGADGEPIMTMKAVESIRPVQREAGE